MSKLYRSFINWLERIYDATSPDTVNELQRIKQGLHRCEITTIIDNGDMCDLGWTTIKDTNDKLREKDALINDLAQRLEEIEEVRKNEKGKWYWTGSGRLVGAKE